MSAKRPGAPSFEGTMSAKRPRASSFEDKCRVRLSVILSRSSGTRGIQKILWTWKSGFITEKPINEEKPDTMTCALRECKEVSFFVGELFSAMKSFSANAHHLHPKSDDGKLLYEDENSRGSRIPRMSCVVDERTMQRVVDGTMRRPGRTRQPRWRYWDGYDWTYHVWFTTAPYHVHGGRVIFVVHLTEYYKCDAFVIERRYFGDEERSTPIISRQSFTTNFLLAPEFQHDLKYHPNWYKGIPPHVNSEEDEEFGAGSTLRDMLNMGREKGLEGEITWAREVNASRNVMDPKSSHENFLIERQSNSSKARLCFFSEVV